MLANSVFYGCFFIQLLLISVYFPRLVKQRVAYVIEEYPAQEYPKLYPYSPAYMEREMTIFTRFNYLICCVGVLLVIASLLVLPQGNYVPEMSPMIFFMLQMMPFFKLEMSECSVFSAMKKANNNRVRTTLLAPRRLTDFVSTPIILTAVTLILVSIAVDIYVNQHIETFLLGMGKGTFGRTITILVTNSLLAVVVWWNIQGKRLDPHQDNKDRLQIIAVTVRSLFYVSMGLSVFLIVREGTDDMQIDHWQPVLMTVYCIVIGYFSMALKWTQLSVDDINFDVYKADAKN